MPALHHADDLLGHSVDAEPLPGCTAAQTAQLLHIARWTRDFLTMPHPDLGRAGQVCPYVGASIRARRLLLTLIEQASSRSRDADQAVIRLGQHFLQLEPTAPRLNQRKAIIVLFPDVAEHDAAEVINGMHRRLKLQFLQQGMMLGEFYRESQKPGLHNPEFRPLRSDVPLLVIRAMVPTDIAFLADQSGFVRAFLRNFKAHGCGEVRRFVGLQRAALSSDQVAMLLGEVARCEAGSDVSSYPKDASTMGRQGE